MSNINQTSINHKIYIMTIITRWLILEGKTPHGWLRVILDMKTLYKVCDDVGFSLYSVLSVYYVIVTSEVK